MNARKIVLIALGLCASAAACAPISGEQVDVNQIVQATFQAMTAQASGSPTAATTGSISGALSYPSEFIPPLRVVAFLTGTNSYFFVDTVQNQGSYQINNLPPGVYHVVAYPMGGGFSSSFAGGYTQAVPCGLSVDCTDHTLIDVAVAAGQTAQNVNPGDWYAPEGSFPPYPLP